MNVLYEVSIVLITCNVNALSAYLFVRNNLLIELIGMNLLFPVGRLQKVKEVVEKLSAVILDVFFRIFPNQQHLSNMTFALDMTVKRNSQ